MTCSSEAEGSIIELQSKRFATAETLSQWLRLRGKEAKNNAGERAHWSRIAQATAISHGERPWH